MSPRNSWLTFFGSGLLSAIGLGVVIYYEIEDIEKTELEAETIATEIASARKTIEGTPSLEREVIVLREMSEVISQILPDEEGVNNLINTLYDYSGDSGVAVTSYKPKPAANRAGSRSAFESVAYTLALKGDTFKLIDLLNRIETHSRLVTVPAFTLSASSRRDIEDDGVASHSITLDVETYTYERKGSVEPVKIDGYERKRDLLAGEISRRRQALSLARYNYRGPRGRRDPWIDPRVPAHVTDESALSVQDQMDLVEGLNMKMKVVLEEWTEVEEAPNELARMLARRDVERAVADLQEDLRRLEADGQISYVPAKKRLRNDVYDPLDELLALLADDTPTGPSREVLTELHESMHEHISLGEYALALDAYSLMLPNLEMVVGDPIRMHIVNAIKEAHWEAQTLSEFEKIELNIGGVAIIEGRPPAIVLNGRAIGIGDRVVKGEDELELLDIRPNEIDFYFRGVVLTRIF
ncbi:MAG: Tfp pilus assembly protein PilO [Planctomycetota bacterium]|jgi:Tfp pilus assembly protein PilO